jgi:Rod binding domain-containing protein
MIDSLSTIQRLAQNYQQAGLSNTPAAQQVKTEFMAIFYKELLKQSFQSPSLSLGGDDDNNPSPVKLFASDILVEKLAMELARNGAISADQLFPAVKSEDLP